MESDLVKADQLFNRKVKSQESARSCEVKSEQNTNQHLLVKTNRRSCVNSTGRKRSCPFKVESDKVCRLI